ncbi:MAG: NUDIX hydrolase [Patescibacteria group bacterium]|nr:NUDIX hydrolase [Patescibacteria group bacterium]
MDKGLIVHTLIFNDKKQVLITKRAKINDVLPEYWDIPGGTLEEGEDPMVGAMRETKEESGIDIENPNLFFQFSNIDTGKNKQFITLVFLAEYSSGDIKLSPEEHEDYAWIDMVDSDKYKKVSYLQDCFDLLNSKSHNVLKF